jgi:outer membrane protein assembly factor BamB
MGGQVGGGMRANIQMPVMTTPQNPPAIKDGTLYTIQGSALIAVDANSGKKKFQCQIDAWRDETPDATGRPRNQLMRAKLRMAPGLAQTVPSFAIDGNIAYVNAGQLGIYAVRLDDGLAQWALGTSNMPVGDMVLLDGVLYFGTSEDQTGNVMMPGVGLLRPAQPPAAVGAAPAKPADEGKDVMPAGLHALKVK